MNKLSNILKLCLSVIFIANVSAADLTDVNQIISLANKASYYGGDDGRAQARMKITDAKGNRQLRQFTILRKDHSDEGDQDMLVFFSRPTDVKGTVFRVEKKIDNDDNRWLYLPALDLVKRISAGDKRTSFVGSDFYYEDVSGRNPKEDNFTLTATDDKHYIIKAVPKDKSSVEFAHYIVKIDKNHYLPMAVDYFDAQGNLMRQMQVLKTKLIDGVTTVMHSKISDLERGSHTEMQFRKVKYNLGLPEQLFSERSLRKPPTKWLK